MHRKISIHSSLKSFLLKVGHKKSYILILGLTITLLGAVVFLLFQLFSPHLSIEKELQSTNLHQMTFEQLRSYFSSLAKREGAPFAFNVLKQASLPPNTDLHLLGHVIGEVLYQQAGADGIQYCTHDFRNACSHTIVVGLFLDKGEAALVDIAEACKKAPGGSGAYTMCYHGLGHGILSFTNFDLKQTAEICKKTGTPAHGNREYPECIGGAIMEQISGGDHDRENWSKQRQNNLKGEQNPLYPCSSDIFTDQAAKNLCYLYITPHLFEVAGTLVGGIPTSTTIAKAFNYCEEIPTDQKESRNYCFRGFGKEFIVLAKDRDIRKVESMDKREIQQVINWCYLTEAEDGKRSCISSTVGSLFWGGENKRTVAIDFCNMIKDSQQEGCFTSLTDNIKSYIKDRSYRRDYCNEIPLPSQDYCKKQLL